jgi:beta-glucosidase
MTRAPAGGAGAGGGVQLPIKQLAGFRRVPLSPGEKQTISFPLPHDHIALEYWDEQKQRFTYKPGDVDLLVGASSADIRLQGKVTLA